MIPKLKISTFVLRRLEKIKHQCSGCLFGIVYDGTILILSFNIESASSNPNYKQIQSNFPAELDLCGLVKFGSCTDSQAHLNEILQDVDVTDNPILLHSELGSVVGLRASLFKHGQLEDIKFEITEEDELFNNFLHTRIECNLDVLCQEDDASVRSALQNLRKYVASGKTGFHVKNTSIYLIGASTGTSLVGIANKSKIEDLFNASTSENGDDGFGGGGGNVVKTKKKAAPTETNTDYDVLKIALLLKLTKDKDSDQFSPATTKFVINSENEKTKIPLQIDSLALLHKKTDAIKLYDILIESVCRSIRLIERNIVEQKFFAKEKVGVPVTFNFQPRELGHFFSAVYFSKSQDDDEYLVKIRKKFHQQFALPLNRPQFKRSIKYQFKGDQQKSKYLINPHLGIKSQVKDGKQYLVSGLYTYYHYMQDGFDDNGWGCAYRSLQTLCSWFLLQGYTDVQPPTHRAIQTYLADIGDKPSTFIGSKQWIGSTEVSMCLDGLIGVVSRILRVESGGDLATHGPTLVRHFETQGTPIMIGGGVLAHTILGVDFNSTTNELKFLILDPHYTGSDDLATVQSKRWCGWKGCDFWDKKSYYNLCMPQLSINNCF